LKEEMKRIKSVKPFKLEKSVKSERSNLRELEKSVKWERSNLREIL